MSQQANPFNRLTVIIMAAIGFAAFIALLAGMGLGEKFAPTSNGQAHGASNSIVGYKALANLMEKTGTDIQYSRNKAGYNNTGLLVLTPNPYSDAEELAEIAQMTANVATTFGFDPVVALLSYSNFGSSNHKEAKKVREAVRILHERNPKLIVDGEIQTDFALSQDLCHNNFPFSKLAGRKVNTLVFPNLDAANITYKLLKELNGADSIGPIMMGLKKPVHILQLDASVDEIVNMAAIAVIDAQEKAKKHA